jgi:iron(III) transport system substrate-binding protein
MKKALIAILIVSLALCFVACSKKSGETTSSTATAATKTYSGKVMLYSSMQEAQLQAVKEAFEKAYPGITMDYYFASGGKVLTKMTTEAQGGQIAADVVWLGDPCDYEGFKANGWLEKYSSPEENHIAKAYIDPDGYYTAGRLVTMGIAWNTTLVKDSEAPKTWNELLDPKWKNQIIMTDPDQASTTKYWMTAMMQSEKYGEAFFQALYNNGTKLESGTTATHNRVADGSYKIGICLDYVSANLIAEGSPMNFHFTTADVVTMTSPVALIKGCANPDNGKLLIDFLLSKAGQEVLVEQNLVSVRDDVAMKVDTSAIAAVNMPVDFIKLGQNMKAYQGVFNKIWNK